MRRAFALGTGGKPSAAQKPQERQRAKDQTKPGKTLNRSWGGPIQSIKMSQIRLTEAPGYRIALAAQQALVPFLVCLGSKAVR